MQSKLNKKEIAGLEVSELPGDPGGPVVLLFHGFGANALDLVPLSGVYKERPRPTWLFPNGPLEIPIAPGYSGRAWFEIDVQGLQTALQQGDWDSVAKAFPPDLEQIRKRMELFISELEIPRSKLLFGGFSQGAVLATELALNGIDRVAALLIFSGTLVSESTWRRLARRHASTPFFQSHGRLDAVLPVKKAEELTQLLQEGGLKGDLHVFEGGHDIPQQTLVQLHAFLDQIL
ncbi:MAG: hypothetical protein S4CHLAM2_01100 [Chlamydiales bacterium]|nr:hypothetical protein [Chlamydiales bacterium]